MSFPVFSLGAVQPQNWPLLEERNLGTREGRPGLPRARACTWLKPGVLEVTDDPPHCADGETGSFQGGLWALRKPVGTVHGFPAA